MEVEFSADAIVKVTVTEHQETPGLSDPAIEKIPQRIVDGQTLHVDAISGATNTSNAILEAVADCVVQAGGDAEALKTKQAQANTAVEEMTVDVVVVGGGAAGLSAAIAAAEAGADVVIVENRELLEAQRHEVEERYWQQELPGRRNRILKTHQNKCMIILWGLAKGLSMKAC